MLEPRLLSPTLSLLMLLARVIITPSVSMSSPTPLNPYTTLDGGAFSLRLSSRSCSALIANFNFSIKPCVRSNLNAKFSGPNSPFVARPDVRMSLIFCHNDFIVVILRSLSADSTRLPISWYLLRTLMSSTSALRGLGT